MNAVENAWIEDEHPMVKDEIPAKYIRNVWDETSKSWKPFNRVKRKEV